MSRNDNRKPNLVYIFPDELRAQAMGFRGEDPVITPNLDAFAAESLVFQNAYSNSPLCSPYRGILFTGKYPHENGVVNNCHSGRPGCFLQKDARCLSDILADNGYQCGYIGKWHLDFPQKEDYPFLDSRREDGFVWDAYTPPGEHRHGFSFWYSYGCCDRHFTPHYWKNDGGIEKRINIKQWSPVHETDVAVDYIKGISKEKPFALFLAHNPPHMPFDEVPEEYLKLYEGKSAEELLTRPNAEKTEAARENVKRYFAAISGLDVQLKRVLDALDEAGIRDNTIVIYTSDHGEMMGSHGRMYKGCCYDEAFKVPLIIRYPEKIRPRTTDMLISTVDLLPTMLDMMGLGESIPDDIPGKSVGDAILENRDGDISQILYTLTDNRCGFADKRYTFAMERADDTEPYKIFLFDHQEDPFQMHNIAMEKPALVKECRRQLIHLLEKYGNPLAQKLQ